jgi:hypothetical protein
MAAAWPTLAALKQVLDVTSDDWDGEQHLEGIRQAAIEQVKLDVGDWDDASDAPDYSLARAAMLLAVRMAKAPAEANIPLEAASDPAYQRLLKGHRRRFAIA